MVYQEKDKKKWTKDGRSWFFRCYYDDAFGERKQKKSQKYFKKSEAQIAEREFLNSIKKTSSVLFYELKKIYMEDYKSKNKYETYLDTNNRIEKHLIPVFGDLKVSSINVNHFNILKEKINYLDIKTKNSIITYLKSILQFGVDNYDLDIPVLPKIKTIPKGVTPPRKYNIWDVNQFNKFISVVDDTLYKAFFTLLYYSGLRLGEALALTWNDINGNIVSITKSCNKRGKKITLPKTSNSFREIDLPNVVVNALNVLYEKEKDIIDFSNNFYVFGGVEPIARTTLSRDKDKYVDKSMVKRITIHEFRHSHVSLLRSLGYSVKQVADRIGDTESTVIETYSHLFEEDKFTISNGLNEISNKSYEMSL